MKRMQTIHHHQTICSYLLDWSQSRSPFGYFSLANCGVSMLSSTRTRCWMGCLPCCMYFDKYTAADVADHVVKPLHSPQCNKFPSTGDSAALVDSLLAFILLVSLWFAETPLLLPSSSSSSLSLHLHCLAGCHLPCFWFCHPFWRWQTAVLQNELWKCLLVCIVVCLPTRRHQPGWLGTTEWHSRDDCNDLHTYKQQGQWRRLTSLAEK